MARRRGVQKGRIHQQGKMWYVAYREDALNDSGEIVQVRRNKPLCQVKGVSKKEAQRIANEEVLNKINTQSQRPSSMLTVKQFVEGRFKTDVVRYMKHAGQIHYNYVLENHVLPAIGEMRLRDVSNDAVQSLVGLKHDSGLSSQTVYHIKNAISAVFRHAKVKKAFFGDLPTEGVRMPEMVRKEIHAMSFDQAVSLLEGLKDVSTTAFAMVALALTTSMNIAEILGLRRKRVNLSKDSVMLNGRSLGGEMIAVRENFYRGKFGTVKAKARLRDLPIPQALLPVLNEVMNGSAFKGPDDLVFGTEKGTPLDEKNLMRRVIKPIASRLNMAWLGWHGFRHTHSTLAEQIGMALADRQAQMGHGDYRMTLHYTHADLDRRRRTLDSMGARLLGTSSNGDSGQRASNMALIDTNGLQEKPVTH